MLPVRNFVGAGFTLRRMNCFLRVSIFRTSSRLGWCISTTPTTWHLHSSTVWRAPAPIGGIIMRVRQLSLSQRPSPDIHFGVKLTALTVCLRPSTYFSSESYFNQKGLSRSQLTGLQKPNITRGSWMLFEDRKGKPGWISNVSRSSMEIPFSLSGGHKASLTISWAHSYESFGDMRARVYRADSRSDSTGWVVLPGKVSGARVSVPASETWDSDSGDHAGKGLVKQEWLDAEWEIQRFVLEVQAQKLHRAQKVKLLSVISC